MNSPVLDRFAETLASVALARSELAPRCESLISELQTMTETLWPETGFEPREDDLRN